VAPIFLLHRYTMVHIDINWKHDTGQNLNTAFAYSLLEFLTAYIIFPTNFWTCFCDKKRVIVTWGALNSVEVFFWNTLYKRGSATARCPLADYTVQGYYNGSTCSVLRNLLYQTLQLVHPSICDTHIGYYMLQPGACPLQAGIVLKWFYPTQLSGRHP